MHYLSLYTIHEGRLIILLKLDLRCIAKEAQVNEPMYT